MMGNWGDRIVLFDGICNLCNGAVQFIISRDPAARFSFTSLQSAAGQEILDKFNLPRADFDSFVYVRVGQVYTKSTGALRVLKDLGGFWKFFYVFMIIPRPIRDMLYNLVARSRYRIFGRRDACMVPTPELQKRFL